MAPPVSAPVSPTSTYRLRRRLLLVISLLVTLVLGGGAATAVTAIAARQAIADAHALEVTSRRCALLSLVAREQYIHEAHTIILRDRSHVGHHNEWVEKLNSELRELRPDLDATGAERLDAIGAASRELTELFAGAILPAIDRADWVEVHHAHDRANALVDRMTEQADALSAYFDGRAVRAEQEALRVIRLAVALLATVGILAALLALAAGRSLWRAFSTPLASLERVAQQVARGNRAARVEPIAAVELRVVADAFNRMLDALARAEADIIASERLAVVGRVAAGVAHEINNPIAVIRGYARMMLKDPRTAEFREDLGILDEEAAACQRIAEELLMYSRSPAMEPRPVEAADLLRGAATHCEASRALGAEAAESSPITVDAEPALISVDALRIRQVIVNLAANAREATEGGAAIEVHGRRQGDGYVIEVLDRGKGIPDEARAHIFEPFYTTRRNGTGLGLAVCYGLVTAHGGTIRAEPRPGGGSRFVVDLPNSLVTEEADGAPT